MTALNVFVYTFMAGLIALSQAALASEKQIWFRNQNFTLIRGRTSYGNLSTRDTAPSSCPCLGTNYQYVQISGISDGGEACIGWELSPSCGNGSWDNPDWTNIQDAMGEIVSKGGQLSSSKAGAWNGTLLTAEFSDRDTSLFDFFLAEVDVKSSTIYWSRNNDSAQVTRVPSCP
jgi:hypothetical protein